MKNTNYILELIIAGLGTLTWMFILLITFVDINWTNIFLIIKKDNLTPLLAVYSVFLLPFVYITGVVADRIVDELFDILFANKMLNNHFDTRTKYTQAIARIYYMSATFKANYDYGRMRIRICRVWAFNAFLCFIAANLFWFVSFENFVLLHKFISPKDMNVWTLSLYSSGFFLTSSLIAFRAWYTLTNKECVILKVQNEFLIVENGD